jgi:hypothetical protein
MKRLRKLSYRRDWKIDQQIIHKMRNSDFHYSDKYIVKNLSYDEFMGFQRLLFNKRADVDMIRKYIRLKV